MLGNRVLETTTTTGTGDISLAGAQAGHLAFSQEFSDGDSVYYVIEDAATDEFEIGFANYNTSQILRSAGTVLRSTNAGALVDLGSGSKNVFCAVPATKYAYLNGSGTLVLGYTASRAVATDASGDLVVSAVTGTELGYLAGVTSAVQTQLDAKAVSGGAEHDGFSDFVAAEHVVLPNTIANVLSDHNLAAHTALGLFDASSDVDHDATTNFVANEHLDWTAASAAFSTTGNLHCGSIGVKDATGGGDDAFALSYSPQDDTLAHGMVFNFFPYSSVTGTHHNYAMTLNCIPDVDFGVTESGSKIAFRANAYADAGMAGTLSAITGMRFQFGQNAGTGTITTATGIKIRPLHKTGTIDTSIGIYIQAPETGGTVTTEWAILSDDDAPSQLAGDLYLNSDAKKLYVGAGQDGSVSYDGTDLYLNAQEVGTGHVVLGSAKTSAGDPAGVEGKLYWNTVDNVIKMYADGAWRTLASW